jgi:hypothetical protein
MWYLPNMVWLNIKTLFCKVNNVACMIGLSVNPLHKYSVTSTYEHYYARYIFNFRRSKYERKSYLNCMVNMFSLSVNTLLNWFFFQNLIFLIHLKFQWQKNSKFNISCTLGLKIMKQIPLNPCHSDFSNNTKNAPRFY